MTNVEVRYPIILYFKMARATRLHTSAFEIPCSIFDILFFDQFNCEIPTK
jgi:hypothetical protein